MAKTPRVHSTAGRSRAPRIDLRNELRDQESRQLSGEALRNIVADCDIAAASLVAR
jgi:hypothetical protein